MHINRATLVVISCKPTNVNIMLVRGNVRAGSSKSLEVLLCGQKILIIPPKSSDKKKGGPRGVSRGQDKYFLKSDTFTNLKQGIATECEGSLIVVETLQHRPPHQLSILTIWVMIK